MSYSTPTRVITIRPDLDPKPRGPRAPVPPTHPTRRATQITITPTLNRRPRPAEPTLVEMATNFAGAMARWGDAGFKTVTKEQYDERSAACEPCEYWDGSARLGLGKCTAPGCGCTKLKRWLVSERCMHPEGSRWPVLQPPVPQLPPPA